MSKKDAVVLAGRTLGLLLIVWALVEVTYLPAYVQSYTYFSHHTTTPSNFEYLQHMSHNYLTDIGFCFTKIVGFSLLARWLFKGGAEVSELLLPSSGEEIAVEPDGSAVS